MTTHLVTKNVVTETGVSEQIELKTANGGVSQDVSQVGAEAASSTSSEQIKTVATMTKLPYQANHQVELLHLQAETEALLQQLKTLKQQRMTANTDSLSSPSSVPVWVAS
ncbi:MAG: hypothetical protein IGS38_24220 [Synechococcales cyanobacterium M58_A2018_015]|nr:hypothetical protein [Synechococcales cyanobacterium M58_A2018_015]